MNMQRKVCLYGFLLVFLCNLCPAVFPQAVKSVMPLDSANLKQKTYQVKPQVIPKTVDLGKSMIKNIKILEKVQAIAFVDTHFVLVKWTYLKNAQSYNVYRKQLNSSYAKINKKLIKLPQTTQERTAACSQFGKMMPTKTYPWEISHILKVLDLQNQEAFAICNLLDDENYINHFRLLGNLYFQLAMVTGLSFADSSVAIGQSYYYKVTYLDENNVEQKLGNEVHVVAGQIRKMSQPTGLTAYSGDTQVLLLWNDPPAVDSLAGFHVYRSSTAGGTFARIDSIPVLTTRQVDLYGDSLKPPRFGYLDDSVENDKVYYYKIAPRNALGRTGTMSSVAQAKPTDQTKPKMPANINITALGKSTLMISWNLVTQDTAGRTEKVKGYHVYRYTDYSSAMDKYLSDSQYKIAYVAHPQSKKQTTKSGRPLLEIMLPGKAQALKDTCYKDSNIEPEKVYWYRICCEDSAANIGHKSAAIYGMLPDIVAPDPPIMGTATSDTLCVQLTWSPPDTLLDKNNKDLAGYLIYRGICGKNEFELRTQKPTTFYTLDLLVDITDKNTLTYKDCSLPKGSPLCYRYAIKAYDKPQNQSGFSDSVCIRLRDRTPPDAPVITSLQARNRAIKLESVAPPIQDMKDFLVERRKEGESQFTVVYKPAVRRTVGCANIPTSVDEILAKKVNQFSYLDKNVEPEMVYWYRVKAVDLDSNVSAPSPAISAFTYEINTITKPARIRIKQDGCKIVLQWQGAANASNQNISYVIFRSTDAKQGYRQLGEPVQVEEFIDSSVASGMVLWYRIQTFDKKGDRSELSTAVMITVK